MSSEEKNSSVDEILSEYLPQKSRKPASPAEISRRHAEADRIIDEMYGRAPTPDPEARSGEIISSEVDFTSNADFQNMFHSENKHVDPEPEEDEPVKKPKIKIKKQAEPKSETPAVELSPAESIAGIERGLKLLKMRLLAALVLNIPLLYLTFAHRLNLPLPESVQFLHNAYSYVFVAFIFQLLVMALAYDLLARGCYDLFRLRPSLETGVVLGCLASTFHVFSIFFLGGQWGVYLPYCAVSAASVAVAMWGWHAQDTARLKTYQVASVSGYSVAMEPRLYTDVNGITKRRVPPQGFVAQTEERDNIQGFFAWFIPFALVLSIVLAFIGSVAQDRPKDFFWVLAALMTCITPLCALMSFNLPFVRVAKRLSDMGGAIAGWAAARQFYKADSVIITDLDLFPNGQIAPNGHSNPDPRAIVYAASLLVAFDSGLSKPMLKLLRDSGQKLREVRDLRPAEGDKKPERGLSGIIGNDRVLVGPYPFLVAEGVKLPKHQADQSTVCVYVAINKELAGTFVLKYAPLSSVRRALQLFVLNKLNMMFAVRDFNLTQESLKQHFPLTDDQIDYLVVEERLKLSNHDRLVSAKTIAAVDKEGALPYAECVAGALRLRHVAKINLMLSALSAVVGLLIMFFLVITQSASGVSPVNILLYQLLGLLVVWVVSGWAGRY
ncbi:hypothetical protein FACS1894217_12870 [Clostridia bacterium]|nr:hypothetical protein FACS1894217_12870 [Clostridia bacterium]